MDQAAATTAVRQLLNGLVGAASPDFNVEAGDPIGNSDENGIVGYIGQVKAIDPAPSANWVAAAEASEFSINHAVEHTKAAVTAVTATPPDFTTAETEMRLALAFLTGSIGRPNAVTASPGGSLPEGFTHDTRLVEGGLLLLLECAGGDMTTCP
jgi:hypothetical protein